MISQASVGAVLKTRSEKPLFLPIIAYTLSTTKLEIRAK
jgi:hypothetical protein